MATLSRRLRNPRILILMILLCGSVMMGTQCPFGLGFFARLELHAAGVDKYLGDFTPSSVTDIGGGYTKYTFDTAGGDGPICIAGTPYSVFTKAGDPKKLLIFLQGGGACWQNFYFCNVFAEAQSPPAPPVGIWDFGNPDNPFKDHSIVYMPYCDGSVFAGDNTVIDPAFSTGGGVRHHRGLRNQSAGMDVAKSVFPEAKNITVAGTSAGGVGVAGFTPFLVRFEYGNSVVLNVFNDAGPIAINETQTAAIAARAADWAFGQFYPASCTECDDHGQATAVVQWRLDHDWGVREAFYETDADATNRFFLAVPTQAQYRDILLTNHDPLNATHPLRYKRFIVSGDTTHGALQSPLFYTQDANGVLLNDWTEDFLKFKPGWQDIVEDLIPLP
jgi:hypothetical protein